jgi:hypothetical protein
MEGEEVRLGPRPGMLRRNAGSSASPLNKRMLSGPPPPRHPAAVDPSHSNKAAMIPRDVRKKAWATMRRGGQINLMASLVRHVDPSPHSTSTRPGRAAAFCILSHSTPHNLAHQSHCCVPHPMSRRRRRRHSSLRQQKSITTPTSTQT